MTSTESKEGASTLIKGVIGLAIIIVANWVVWRVCFAPNGTFKLYTPMYGFSLLGVFLFCIIFFTDISDLWPFQMETFSWGKGIGLLIASLVMMWLLVFGVFWNVIGRFGITYFSPYSITKTGTIGSEMFSGRENTSVAIVYLFTCLIWVTVWWRAGFGATPWQKLSPGAATASRFAAISFISIIIYAIFYHPHVCYLFYPAQKMAGVEPWWSEVAMTSSAYYHLGWMVCSLFILILAEVTLEGWPWSLLKKDGQGNLASALCALVISIILGFVLFYGMEAVMNYYWEEPFLGGNYLDAPFFRHLHAAEVAMFFIIGAYILQVFFNNFPTKKSALVNGIVRVAIVLVIGLLLRTFYYSEPLGTGFLDRVPGIGQPDDTPLCWSMLLLSMIMIYDRFLNRLNLK